MVVSQRRIGPTAARPTLWSGTLPGTTESTVGQDFAPTLPRIRSTDQYVTVDERVEGVIGVVAADWPRVDRQGLRFDGNIESAWFGADELQRAVDRHRGIAGQLSRPLRIGDTFWVRGYDSFVPDNWEQLRDITGDARAMVKGAVAVVAVGEVDPGTYLTDDIVGIEVAPDQEPAEESAAAATPTSGPGGSATASPVI